MSDPKVFIGCPTWIGKKYCINRYLNGIAALDYPEKYFMIVDNTDSDEYINLLKEKGVNALKGPHDKDPKKTVVDSRNILREEFLKTDFEYFLSLEQDVIPPPNAIKTLLANNARVVSGVYFTLVEVNNKAALDPMAFVSVTQEWIDKIKAKPDVYKEQYAELKKNDFDPKKIKRRLTFEEVKEPDVIEVNRVGLGCMLIHREVLEKFKFRYNPTGYDDMTFCSDVLDNKWKILLDTSVKCKHFINKDEIE
tara:strand:- start:47 stop:799 length:753 start_codon:yes stop_codon:yes gene_type:complete